MALYYKIRHILLQNITVALLQNQVNVYHKLLFYYNSIVIVRGPSRFDAYKFNQFKGQWDRGLYTK